MYNKYCGIVRSRGGSIFVKFLGTSHPQINILHELINKDYKLSHIFFLQFKSNWGIIYVPRRLKSGILNKRESVTVYFVLVVNIGFFFFVLIWQTENTEPCLAEVSWNLIHLQALIESRSKIKVRSLIIPVLRRHTCNAI